ncbi:MAG: glucose-6-phosphate dehydrogenase assembly protein OpcA, partial [Actinomycetes bacterium]
PDAPVVAWWPGHAPAVPGEDPVGTLAQRRVTDAAATSRPLHALTDRGDAYHPGDTDLAWTRLTPWRTLLAAALDQPHGTLTSAEVTAERGNPSGELLALWLGSRLDIPVERQSSRGPGITDVRLHAEDGEIVVSRPDGRVATLSRPDQPDRPVALQRRDLAELVAEELRRLDPDDVYGETVRLLAHDAAAVTP